MADLEILVADDHPLFRKGVTDMLRAEPGIRVAAEAGDGEQALALIERLKPALALLDMDMPKLNGLGVAEAVRARGLPTAVVLLTMYAEGDLIRRAIELGVKGYVSKESAVQDVVACVRLVAEGRTYVSPTLSHLIASPARAATTPALPGLAALTDAEREVLSRVARNLTTKQIAAELGVSPKTVENHRGHICGKLGLTGTNALIRFALEHKAAITARSS